MAWGTMQPRGAPGDVPNYPGSYMPGTYAPPSAPTVGGGFGDMMSGMGSWLGGSAFESPDQGLLSQSTTPRMNRMTAIGELLTGAASGYMQGLNSGVRGSQWGMAGIGGFNALKAAKEDEYQKQRQEVLDRIQYLNATKKNDLKSRVVPPGAVVLDENNNPVYSNPKGEAKKEPTGDAAMIAALTSPDTPPEERKYWEGIYQDKIRGPVGPAAPQAPEIIRTAQYLFPKDPAAQRDWISGQKEKREPKPPADLALVEALNSPDTPPEQKAALQALLDKKTHITEPRAPADPEVVRTAEHLFPDDPVKQNDWILAQKDRTKPPPKPSAELQFAQALNNPDTPADVRETLQQIFDHRMHPNADKPTPLPADPEIVKTAKFLHPDDPEAQRAFVEEQKKKTPPVKYLKMEDGSYQPVPETPQAIPAQPKPVTLSPEELKLKSGAEDALTSGEGTLSIIGRLQELNPQVPGGPLTGVTKYATILSNPEQYAKTQELSTLATQQAVGQLKSTFGAQPTEGERKILLEVSGSVDQPPEVRAKIYQRAREAVEARQKMTKKRLEELSSGSYGKATPPDAPKIRVFNPATGRLE
jgi:hypothetical protein